MHGAPARTVPVPGQGVDLVRIGLRTGAGREQLDVADLVSTSNASVYRGAETIRREAGDFFEEEAIEGDRTAGDQLLVVIEDQTIDPRVDPSLVDLAVAARSPWMDSLESFSIETSGPSVEPEPIPR